MGELTSIGIVNSALEMGDTAIHDAIISLLFTTGLDKNAVRNITIKDLLQSAELVFEKDEPHTLDVLFKKEETDKCLCWTFENDSKHQVIFSSPVTSRYIIKYLKNAVRYHHFNDYDELFQTKDDEKYGQIKENYISGMFNKKKDALMKYKDIPKDLKFTPASFKDHFSKVSNEHLTLDESDKAELICLFIGEANDENKYYKEFKKDKNSILKYYEELLPYLEVEYFENKYAHNPSPIKNGYVPSPIKEGYSDFDIWIIVKNYFHKLSIKHNSPPDYNNTLKWTNIAFDIAKQDNKDGIFKETDEYLDELYKKTYLRIFFENIDINIVLKTEFDYQDASVEVAEILAKHGFFEKFDVDIDDFQSVFMDIIECSFCSKIDTNVVIGAIESAYYLNYNLKLIEEDI